MLKKITIFIILLAIAAGGYLAYVNFNKVSVEVYTVKAGSISEYIDTTASIELGNLVKVFSQVNGTVQQINVTEGDSVIPDKELLIFDTRDLDYALKKAREAYDSAKAILENTKTSIKPEQIDQARLQMQQAEVSLKSARDDYEYKKGKLEKKKLLLSKDAISEQEVRDFENVTNGSRENLQNSELSLKIAKINYKLLKGGVSKYSIDSAEAEMNKARLALEELQTNRNKYTARSSIEGIVLLKYVEIGQTVQPGTLLFEIGDYKTAYISAELLVDDAKYIKIGDRAVVDDKVLEEKQITGEVYFLAPKAEKHLSSLGIEERRIEVRLKCNGEDLVKSNLKPGYDIDLKIFLNEKQNTLYVPYKSVYEFDGKKNVLVVSNDRLMRKAVKTGIENDDYIEIVEGVAEGDKVVTIPSNSLKEGKEVKIR